MPISTERSDLLRRVRALVAKAEGTDNQHEADAFRAKAESLMLKYRIEQHELGDQHEDNVVRDTQYDFNWYEGPHGSSLFTLMQYVARHCNVKVVTWRPSWHSMTIPVVGMDSDREYFDMLFTSIMLEFTRGLEPQVDKSKTMIENMVRLKESGQQWLRIAEQLWMAGMLPQFTERPTQKQVHHLNFSGRYTAYCQEHDRPRLRTTPKVYQRSFTIGFLDRIWDRLAAIRQHAQQSLNAGESSGLALVLADAMTRAEHKAVELYGERPTVGRSRGGRSEPARKVDMSAINDGRRAADRVNLGNQKELNS